MSYSPACTNADLAPEALAEAKASPASTDAVAVDKWLLAPSDTSKPNPARWPHQGENIDIAKADGRCAKRRGVVRSRLIERYYVNVTSPG
jgi:hypothetical protein